jgi:hypothetical protein
MSNRLRLACIMAAMAVSLSVPRPTSAQAGVESIFQTRHWSGQGVAPVYEGFDVNGDGTYNLWFGYMNRNYEEELDIPVGAENSIEPGVDHGQPTHFLPRRQKDVFKVVVPEDFGSQKLLWKLTVRGKTEVVAGTLNRVWQIDRRRTTRGGNDDAVDSNTPPVVKIEPPDQTTAPSSATLAVLATDDGLPKRRGKSIGMTAAWSKYRGPGTVKFHPSKQRVENGGRAITVANFSEPGEYLLQVVVDDGSGELAGDFGYHCCWTNAEVKVIVNAGAEKVGPD